MDALREHAVDHVALVLLGDAQRLDEVMPLLEPHDGVPEVEDEPAPSAPPSPAPAPAIASRWTDDFAKFTDEAYRNNVYAYRAICTIGFAMAGLKWLLFKRSARGKRTEIDAHPILDLLRRPQPKKGGAAFLFECEAYTLISGNNYIVGVGPKNGAPRELWNLRPDRVQVRAGSMLEPIAGYEYRASHGEPQFFEHERVLHIAEFNPLNDFYGMGPTKPGSRSIDVDNDGRDEIIYGAATIDVATGRVALREDLLGREIARLADPGGALDERVKRRLRHAERGRVAHARAGAHRGRHGGRRDLLPADGRPGGAAAQVHRRQRAGREEPGRVT